jgi:hypothetical protein
MSWQNALVLWQGERERILGEAKKARARGAEADLRALGPEPKAPPSTDRTVAEPTFEGLTKLFATGSPASGCSRTKAGNSWAATA